MEPGQPTAAAVPEGSPHAYLHTCILAYLHAGLLAIAAIMAAVPEWIIHLLQVLSQVRVA